MKSNKIKNMEIGGRILGEVMDYLVKYVKPGISELDIEREATRLILEKGGKSAFKLVPDYNYTTCIATNEVVVHGIPSNRVLKEGDIVGIDCGVFYGGYNTDMGETIKISNLKSQISNEKDKEVNRFLETGKKALFRAISMAQAGNRVGDISKAIQKTVEGVGYSVVRSLVGHGVGKQLHESPEIPGYLEREIGRTHLLKPGMTLAIEVIYNMGKADVVHTDKDDWTIVTGDRSLSGLFERTILVTEKTPIILTQLSVD